MSSRPLRAAWAWPRGGSEKLLLLMLAGLADDEGGSLHPSIATVAAAICASESQARRVLHKLIAEGFIDVIGNIDGGAPGMTREYRLNLEAIERAGEAARRRTETGVADVTPPAATGGTAASPTGRTSATRTPPTACTGDTPTAGTDATRRADTGSTDASPPPATGSTGASRTAGMGATLIERKEEREPVRGPARKPGSSGSLNGQRGVLLPTDFVPSAVHEKLARRHGLDLERELAAFREQALDADQRATDWPAALSAWLTERAIFGGATDKQRGTRLAIAALPAEWRAFCREQRPDLDPAETFERFADYWRAQPGAKGRKADWLATWRNWVRSERSRQAALPTGRVVDSQGRPRVAI